MSSTQALLHLGSVLKLLLCAPTTTLKPQYWALNQGHKHAQPVLLTPSLTGILGIQLYPEPRL